MSSHAIAGTKAVPIGQKLGLFIIRIVLHAFLKCLYFTARIRWKNRNHLEQALEASPTGGFALAAWHDTLTSSIFGHKDQGYVVLISQSKDGDIIAYLANKFGIGCRRGSSTRGGVKALAEMVEILNAGTKVAFTVDGPKGPPYQVKMGIIKAAQRSGCPILPIGSGASRYWTFHKSWDRFKLPKPFATIRITYGAPMFVPKEAPDEELPKYRDELCRRLRELNGIDPAWDGHEGDGKN